MEATPDRSFEAIAERELAFEPHEGAGPTEAVRFRVGRPVRSATDWYCPFEVEGFGERRLEAAHGADSVQALLLALAKLRIRLGALALEHRGRLRHGERSGAGLPSLVDGLVGEPSADDAAEPI